MANKSTTFTLSGNTLSQTAESTATITGRTVYGGIVSATEVITQAAYVPTVGSLSLTPATQSVSATATATTVTLTMDNMSGTITLEAVGGAYFGSSPFNLTTSVTAYDGSVQVAVHFPQNTGTSGKTYTVQASGTDVGNVQRNANCSITHNYVAPGVLTFSGVTITIINNSPGAVKFAGIQLRYYTGDTMSTRVSIGLMEGGRTTSIPIDNSIILGPYPTNELDMVPSDVQMPARVWFVIESIKFFHDGGSVWPGNATVEYEISDGTTDSVTLTGAVDVGRETEEFTSLYLDLGTFTASGDRVYGNITITVTGVVNV